MDDGSLQVDSQRNSFGGHYALLLFFQ